MNISDDLLLVKDQSFRLICENEYAICFHDFKAIHFGHCVVMLKRRVKHLFELNMHESKAFFELIEKASELVAKATGKNVIVLKNMGEFISHKEQVHFHILPSDYKFGDMYFTMHVVKKIEKRDRKLWTKEELTKVSEKIRNV